MIWNPLKKKQDGDKQDVPPAGDVTQSGVSGGEQTPARPVPADSDDRTDPLIGAGQLEERTEVISSAGSAVELERVEVWGPDGVTEKFLRLSCSEENDYATALKQLLLEVPERTTGFRDLLISDSHALSAKLECPDHSVDEAADLIDSGELYLRPVDVIRGFNDLCGLLDFMQEAGGLAPLDFDGTDIGLVAEPNPIAGHASWRLVFTGWHKLGPGDAAEAKAIAKSVLAVPLGRLAKLANDHGMAALANSVASIVPRLSPVPHPEIKPRRDPQLKCGIIRSTIYGATDVGMRREHNEDAYLIEQTDQLSASGARLTLATVADGMGGHASGEVASSLALALLRQQLSMALLTPTTRPADTAQLVPQLEAIIPAIDRALTERAELDQALSGMGTTLVGFCSFEQRSTISAAEDQTTAVFWVGDSRAYLIGPCGMRPLTRDHSYVQDLIDSGSISADEARSHQMKNVITRCLGGAGNTGTPDVYQFTPGPGEAVLLCSDGLTDAVDDEQIWNTLRRNPGDSWHLNIDALLDAANEAGGPDNITVIIAEFR